jgi:CheY-like chemotaxis protein/HPt (histidine-containing phosphotransfer) domain-containing protein
MKSLSFDFHADLEPTQPAEYPMRLLLVDDSEVNREVAFLMLKAMGHTIETASNGAEALQILARKTFDCVIMDCQMPIMDGYSATRQIRAVDSSVLDHDIHIIAMTANAMDGDREKCLRSGMNDYVPKPIDEIDLQRALRHCEERLIEKNCGSDRDMRQSLSTWDSQIASPTASFFPQTQAPENAAASLSTNETIRLKWNPEPKVREDAFENPMDWAIPKRLVELFISETTNRLNDLEGALDTGDTDCVARIAHTIKGTAGNFQALELFETVKSLECLAATGQLQDARALLSSARNAFALVCTRLDPQKETHAVAIPAEIL